MIFALRQLQEKCLEQCKPLIVVYIDLTKAFDMVCQGGMLASCNDLAAQTHCCLSSAVSTTMCKPMFVTMALPRKHFPLHVALQRCVLAPTLFAIYFSALLVRAFPSTSGVLLHSHSSGKLFNLSRFRACFKTRRVFMLELLYAADDAASVAYSIADAQLLCNSFAAACIDFGMKISLSKSVVLVQGVSYPATINDVALKVAEMFCYLGSNVTAFGSLVSELDARIGKAASTFGKRRSRFWANYHLSIHVKIHVYVVCVLSMLLYGCETWPTYRYEKKAQRVLFSLPTIHPR